MRKLLLSTAVGAVLVASLVRVQLVAVAQDAAPGADQPAAKAPSGPPVSVPREQLTYDGKRFEDYQAILAVELAPDRRAEAIRALTAFAASGYGEEVAKIIFAEMASFDADRYADELNLTLRSACQAGLQKIDTKIVTPRLVEVIRNGDYGSRRIALDTVNERQQGPEVQEAILGVIGDVKLDAETRSTALLALERLDGRLSRHWAPVREIVLAKDAPLELRAAAEKTISVRHKDTEEFRATYAREFGAPVQLAMLERGEIDRHALGAFRTLEYAPQLVVPQVLAWLEAEEPFMNDDLLYRLLAPADRMVPTLIESYRNGDDDDRLRVLKVLRMLVPTQREQVMDADSPAVLAWKAVVPLLGEALASDNAEIAKSAAHCLKTTAAMPFWRGSSLGKEADAELEKHGISFSDGQRLQFATEVNRMVSPRDFSEYNRALQQRNVERFLRNTPPSPRRDGRTLPRQGPSE